MLYLDYNSKLNCSGLQWLGHPGSCSSKTEPFLSLFTRGRDKILSAGKEEEVDKPCLKSKASFSPGVLKT